MYGNNERIIGWCLCGAKRRAGSRAAQRLPRGMADAQPMAYQGPAAAKKTRSRPRDPTNFDAAPIFGAVEGLAVDGN